MCINVCFMLTHSLLVGCILSVKRLLYIILGCGEGCVYKWSKLWHFLQYWIIIQFEYLAFVRVLLFIWHHTGETFLLLWWILECNKKSRNVFEGRISITTRTETVNDIYLLISSAAVQLLYFTESKNTWKMEMGTSVPSWCITEVVWSTRALYFDVFNAFLLFI